MLTLRPLPLFLAISLCCILYLSAVSDAKSNMDYFDVYELQIEGEYIDYMIADLNGDGLNDGLLFHSTPRNGKVFRYFSIFYQNPEGFRQQADYQFEIDPDAIVYDLADVDSNPGKEILFFKNEGIFYYKMVGGRYDPEPVLLLETSSIFKLPDKLFFERLNFARDLNNDGNAEILVPQFHHLLIYAKQADGTYGLTATLDCPMLNSVTALNEVSRYLVSTFLTPNILIVDYNRNQRNDIVTIHDDHLKIFFQNSSGEFSNTNSTIVNFNFVLTQAYASKLGNGNIYQRDRFQDKLGVTTLADLNNNGLLDMIVEKFSHKDGAFNPKKQFHIFFAYEDPDAPQNGGIFHDIPDHIIINRGFQVHSRLGDLNNDGKMDLCIPIIEIGMFKIIQMLITGNIDVTVLWYVMDESGQYPKKPDFEMNVKVEVDTQRRKIPFFSMDGDFNGNGRKDLIRSQDGKLMIHYAPDDGRPKAKADVEFAIEMPDNGQMVKPQMVNADNTSDIVMVFTSDDSNAGNGKVMILINR
ncbi:MAG: VCBS repeat-containing protein [Desulfovibrionales bacterium]